MPLGKDVGKNIKELVKDNKKSGKARGANGKVRPRKQIIAIALNAAGKSKKKTKPKFNKTRFEATKKKVFGLS